MEAIAMIFLRVPSIEQQDLCDLGTAIYCNFCRIQTSNLLERGMMNQQLLLKGIYSPMQPGNLLSKVLNCHLKLRENMVLYLVYPQGAKSLGNEAESKKKRAECVWSPGPLWIRKFGKQTAEQWWEIIT
ncbi:hypothetical protein CFP56_038753 [Quercus suber]|uniref:Uncharacterized protein n=1 Tax=Quercus suber TaxID=58331 RepID=A0AAW0J0Y3_QUESU